MRRGIVAVLAGALLAVALAGAGWRASKRHRIPEPSGLPRETPNETAGAATTLAPEPPKADEEPLPSILPMLPVPELPASAPKRVSFGVILVRYHGAEGAPHGAPAKPSALARARSLLGESKLDFDAAARKGDQGSTSNAGSIPRGVLEPALEHALFTLKSGEIHDEPIDTPKGYWIVLRR
jgi:hypothetical protein